MDAHNDLVNRNQPVTRREEVYLHLKQDIITCQLLPGQLLYEGDLAEQYGVSKTPIREALTLLEKDGLIKFLPRKGYLVTTLTLKDVQEIFEVRLILERAVTVLAAERITEREITELEKFLEIGFQLNDESTIYAYIQANKDFHIAIARASRNQRLVEYMERLLNDAQRLQFMDLETGEGPWAWNRDHEVILEALRKRDKEAAARAVESALAQARVRLLSLDSVNMEFGH
jgi:DNA-binding GntR family transcriptional regulator